MKPKVLHMYNDRPIDWETSVYCGRPSKWKNPFLITKQVTRDMACNRFEQEILPTLDVSELRGKNLVCFCAPKRCHCDSILRKANAPGNEMNPGAEDFSANGGGW